MFLLCSAFFAFDTIDEQIAEETYLEKREQPDKSIYGPETS